MAISVVIPMRDDGEVCSRLLGELAPFRGADFEVLVVEADDSRADPVSVQNPNLDPVDRWLRCPPGRARQLAQGAAAARYSCLWFLHADTRDVADAARWLAQRDARPDQPTGWGCFDVRLDDRRWPYRMVPWFMNWRSRLTCIATGDQGIFVDRELLDAVGGWPQQPLMEDVELCSRLRRRIAPELPPRGAVRLTTSARRWRANGVWRTIVLMWWLRLRYAMGDDPAKLHKSYYEDHRVVDAVEKR